MKLCKLFSVLLLSLFIQSTSYSEINIVEETRVDDISEESETVSKNPLAEEAFKEYKNRIKRKKYAALAIKSLIAAGVVYAADKYVAPYVKKGYSSPISNTVEAYLIPAFEQAEKHALDAWDKSKDNKWVIEIIAQGEKVKASIGDVWKNLIEYLKNRKNSK